MANVPNEFRDKIIEIIPNLRAFAISLSGNSSYADDLVQETIVRAWSKFDTFQTGTNLKAWVFTILRNEYFGHLRRRKREVEDPEGIHAGRFAEHPNQHGMMDLDDFKAALARLPDEQREAIVLIGASGFSYDEAAEICGVAAGTLKSRVSRARSSLLEMLDIDGECDFGPDSISTQVLSRSGRG